MRTAFIQTLCDLAREDDRVWLICGDLGFSVLEVFAEEFPERFVNAGIAEQNMAGLATGLAMSGKIVFIYSIANFPVMRCFEQIRNDICYHNANVKIVSVGGGLAYGSAGYTHHGVEDIGIMRLLPNMKVIAPADPIETSLAVAAIVQDEGPCFLRLGKSREPQLHEQTPLFQIGKGIVVQQGSDVTIFSTGGTLKMVLDAVKLLDKNSIRVVSMHTIQPFDSDLVIRSVKETGRIIAVEEHGLGGLGSSIAETVAGIKCNFVSLRLGRSPITVAGNQEELRSSQGVSVEKLVSTIREMTAK